MLQLAKLQARPQVNKGSPFWGFSIDKIIIDDKALQAALHINRDTLIQTKKKTKQQNVFLEINALALKNQ